MLEEGSFRGRTADFVFMFLFGGFLMTVSFTNRIRENLKDQTVYSSIFSSVFHDSLATLNKQIKNQGATIYLTALFDSFQA